MNIFFIKSISLLIVFLPLALITGPFLPDFFISLSSLLFLFYSYKNNKWLYFNNIFFKYFLIFYFYILIRSLFSESTHSIQSAVFYIRFGVFALVVNFIINNDKFFLRNFLLVLFLTFLILTIDSLIIIFSGQNLLLLNPYNKYRLSSFFYDNLKLGSFILRTSPLIIAIFFFLKKDYKFKNNLLINNLFIFFVSVFSFLVVLYSGERSSFILLILLSFIIILNISMGKINFYVVTVFLFSLLGFILFLINTNKILLNRYIKQFANAENFLENHIDLFHTAYLMFKNNYIFGNGIKSFRFLCDKEQFIYERIACATHPHNTYLELLSETGIVGFILVITPFLFLAYILTKNIFYRSLKNYNVVLLSILFINIFPFTTTGSFFGNWLSILYYLPLGFLLNFYQKK